MAGCVERVQLLGMALARCPCLTCIEQHREYYCPVYLQLCLPTNTFFVPDVGI